MYALILVRYRLPMDEVAKFTDEHRAYLRELKADGTLIASGPMAAQSWYGFRMTTCSRT